MQYKRCLTIQDVSCFGQCSATVALPLISACGAECAVLPTAILSTHTAGFTGYTVRDLSADFPAVFAHWQKEKIKFDAIYTGYLGEISHIESILSYYDSLDKKPLLIVDPAMGDNGRLYPAFDENYVAAMRRLCSKADIFLPNNTEYEFLFGKGKSDALGNRSLKCENSGSPSCRLTSVCCSAQGKSAASGNLSGSGIKLPALSSSLCSLKKGASLILTGASFEDGCTGILVCNEQSVYYYEHELMPENRHGTGDIYASVFTGAYLSGKSIDCSARIAADFTLRCVKKAQGDKEHFYGVRFETEIPSLVNELFG